jgi:hypothetical protein
MGCINFEDHALLKKQWVGKNMNEMGGMFKDEKKQGNCWKQFPFVPGSCARLQSFGIHNNMSVESAIEKL